MPPPSPHRTIYEKLGHAEVVQVDISQEPAKAEQEFRMFAKTYFKQFNRTPFGMARQVGCRGWLGLSCCMCAQQDTGRLGTWSMCHTVPWPCQLQHAMHAGQSWPCCCATHCAMAG